MALSEKQRVFCEVYAGNGGNGTKAAEIAGYSKPAEQSYENLRKPHLIEYIEQLSEDARSRRIATATERQEFWTSVLRAEEPSGKDQEGNDTFDMKDRLKASELLGRSQMDFAEKRVIELTNPADELARLKLLALNVDE